EVLLLELVLQRRDLLVRKHVLDGEDNLVRDREQELRVLLPIPPDLPAPDVQRAQDLALGLQRNREGGQNPILDQPDVLGELRTLSEISREQRAPVVDDPDASTPGSWPHGGEGNRRRRRRGAGKAQDPEDSFFGIVEDERRAIEGNHIAESARDRLH